MDIITKAIIDTLNTLNENDISDNYDSLKFALKKKFGDNSDILYAIEGLERKPFSPGRQVTLQEEIETAEANEEQEIIQLAKDLLENLQKQPEKSSLPVLASNLTAKSTIKTKIKQVNFSRLWLTISLIITAIGGHFLIPEISLHVDKKLIRKCETREYCAGRIEALEKLVQAQKSLKSYDFERANLESVNLSRASLENANLRRASLESANLEQASLYNANLEQANLNSANLNRVDFNNSNLNGADINGADINGAYLNNSNLNGAILSRVKNLTFSQIKSACNWDKAYYKVNWNQENSQWVVDQIANQKFIEKIDQDQASDPQKQADCDRWERISQTQKQI